MRSCIVRILIHLQKKTYYKPDTIIIIIIILSAHLQEIEELLFIDLMFFRTKYFTSIP